LKCDTGANLDIRARNPVAKDLGPVKEITQLNEGGYDGTQASCDAN